MKLIRDGGGSITHWEAESPLEHAAFAYVKAHVSLFAGDDLGRINAFEAGASWAEYQRTNPDNLSESDLLAVRLRVEDWLAIRDNLYEDADGQGCGPAETAYHEDNPPDPDGKVHRAAYDHDYERTPAHACYGSTRRAADTINQALTQHGWTE